MLLAQNIWLWEYTQYNLNKHTTSLGNSATNTLSETSAETVSVNQQLINNKLTNHSIILIIDKVQKPAGFLFYFFLLLFSV